MTIPGWICLVSLGWVAYAYVLYPLLIAAAARMSVPGAVRPATRPAFISVIVAAHNEAANIARRIEELARLVEDSGIPGEIIVVSDGSTDATVEAARAQECRGLRLIELAVNVGKAAALSRGCAEAHGEILVFADARQRWATDALMRLVDAFADPRVGAVGGDLVVEASGANAGVGLYWRYEKWLRRNESAVHSTVGVSGSISAVRRQLFTPIPAGIILDDVYWPLKVVMAGFRVRHEATAVAFDRFPADARGEFRRKVRTLTGNFQLVAALPEALVPFKNPIWFQFVSHKIARLLVPWALLTALFTSAISPGRLFATLFVCQCLGYGAGLVGMLGGRPPRLLSAAASFMSLNAAAWVAFWVWISRRSGSAWQKAEYRAGSD